MSAGRTGLNRDAGKRLVEIKLINVRGPFVFLFSYQGIRATSLKITPRTFVAVPCSDGVWDCSYQLLILPREKEGVIMDWEAPSFVEVKMDSEINSYQDDFKDLPEAQEQPPEAVISTDHE